MMLGLVLGSILPDADNLAVAVATLTKQPTAGIHRTATHSLFFALLVVGILYLCAAAFKRPSLKYIGIGMGMGVILHSLLDLLIWFSGVAILWPFPVWINLWEGISPPTWFTKILDPLELFFFGLFFLSLALSGKQGMENRKARNGLWIWTGIEAFLFVIFSVLAFTLKSGFTTIFGGVYLFSLGLAIVLTIQMRDTLEGFWQKETLEVSRASRV
jgi:membrane-bound metal-dependent hydrolase YbcI (DUF457 family)